MSLVTKLVQDLADRWPLDELASSRVRRRVWISLLQTLQPAGNVHVTCFGMKLRVDPRQRLTLARQMMMRGQCDLFETGLLQRLLRPGMTVMDVGANYGHYTLIAAQGVGSAGNVIAVEPSPVAFDELCANVRLNALDDIVELLPFALGARPGAAKLYHDARRGGHHSLAAANVREPGPETVVPVHTLDEVCGELARPLDLLKLDTQGSEAAILAGGRRVLSHDRPLVLTEFWPHGIAHVGDDPASMLELLEASDYQLLRIGDEGVSDITVAELLAELSPDRRRDDANLLGVPIERWASTCAQIAGE
jgi:FkbM family methyltransferase